MLNWLEWLSEPTTTIRFLLRLAKNGNGDYLLRWCEKEKPLEIILRLKIFLLKMLIRFTGP